jgi:hypothetical protein
VANPPLLKMTGAEAEHPELADRTTAAVCYVRLASRAADHDENSRFSTS